MHTAYARSDVVLRPRLPRLRKFPPSRSQAIPLCKPTGPTLPRVSVSMACSPSSPSFYGTFHTFYDRAEHGHVWLQMCSAAARAGGRWESEGVGRRADAIVDHSFLRVFFVFSRSSILRMRTSCSSERVACAWSTSRLPTPHTSEPPPVSLCRADARAETDAPAHWPARGTE
ncbi:hypothetical protein OH77DRAFT_1425355 [Trametes cingulata]|nr:hypothetical protein OH77DRAFT_1425355 [Trametes cingulata]